MKSLSAGGLTDILNSGILTIILLILVVIVLVLYILQQKKVSTLEKRLQAFMKGRNVSSLENELMGLFKDNKHLVKNAQKTKREIEEIHDRMLTNVCKVGLVKYDAFHQMGGKLSYALCMLDEENNGFILNSVQSADNCYSYMKEISSGESGIELGGEEKQALMKALERGWHADDGEA